MSLLKSTLNPITQRRVRLIRLLSKAEELVHPISTRFTRSPVPSLKQAEPNSGAGTVAGLSINSLFDSHVHLISSHVNKLKKSGHPVLAVARNMFEDTQTYTLTSSAQIRGILVRLVAKAIGLSPAAQNSSLDVVSAILSKQKLLSEITELMHAAFLLHRAVLQIRDPSSQLHHGNKLATLMGDLLLARSTKKLSDLKNNSVTELMSTAICDFSESECIGLSTGRNSSLGSSSFESSLDSRIQYNYNYELWLARTKLALGSLLAHSCLSAMVLAGQDETIKQFAFHLGLNLGLTLQAFTDLRMFVDDEESWRLTETNLSVLWTLPVIHELEANPHLISSPEYSHLKILERVQSSPTAIPHAKETLLSFQQQTSRLVSQLKPSSAASLLKDILQELSQP